MARRMGGFDFLTMKKQFKNNLFAIFFLFLLLFPFFMLFKDFFQPKDLINIKDPQTLRILGFTCYQSFLSTVISFFITLLPSYFSAKNKGVLSKLLENSIFIPFFFPPVSAVIAFSLLFSSTGLLAKSGIKINIMYSFTAIIIAHVFYNSPIFVKYLSEGLRRIPQSLKESAYVEGAGKVKTFFYIELPLILPSISRAFFLVFTYSFTSFAIVLNLGGIKYSTLEVAIATTLKGTLNFSKALSYALIQFIVLTLINIFMSKFEPQSFEYNEPEYSANKKTGKLSLVISIFYLVFEYSLVIIGIASCFFNFITLKFDLSGFINLFSKELNNRFPVIQSIFNSISVSAITGILATIAAYLLLKKYNKIINIAIMSTFGISSAFLGMALLYLNILYNIPFFILIILGFFLISVPLAYSFLYQPILSFDKKIIKAAKVDGANKLVIFSKIELPLLFSSFLSSFLQIFAIIYGEFTISYTMQIRDYFPLSSIVNYSLSSSRFYREATALSGLNVIIIFITFYLSSLIRKKE